MPDSMHLLSIPKHPDLHAALGRLTMAHTHLELIFKYTFKTLSEMCVEKALDATRRVPISKVRETIRKLFKEKRPLPSEEAQLDALLGASERLSEDRNGLLHCAWSQTEAGEAIRNTESHQWEAAPSEQSVDQITSQLLMLAKEINDARLHGFISEVVVRHKEAAKKSNVETKRSTTKNF